MRDVLEFLKKHRSRLARVVFVVGALVVGLTLVSAAPRETHLRFAVGPDHRDVTDVRIAYVQAGEVVRGAHFPFRMGAPEVIRHRVELAPGLYEVRAELRGPRVRRDLRAPLEVPAEGTVRIDLSPRGSS